MINEAKTAAVLHRRSTPEREQNLYLAEEILVAIRAYRAHDAFAEITAMARRHDISVSVAATALVTSATGKRHAAQSKSSMALAAEREWSNLLTEGAHR